MKDVLISIIVPVYKVEKYLNKCIDSILSQSFTNFELILVDDGSPDNCGKICDEYANKDNRIKVIHKENGGLSDARNAGIGLSCGEYLAFIDSDDYISTEFIKTLYDLAKNNDAEISVCDAVLVKEEENAEYFYNEQFEVFNKEQSLLNLTYYRKITVNAWNKLYKKELFDDIRYPKGKLYEDLATTYKLFNKCNKVVYTPSKLYAYLQRDTSIMGQTGYKMKKDKVEIVDEMADFFSSNENYPKIFAGIFNYIINDVYKMASSGNLIACEEYRVELKKWYKKYKNIIKTCQFISKKDRLVMKMGVKSPRLLQFLYYRIRPKG